MGLIQISKFSRKVAYFMNSVTHLDHIYGLDDTGSQHTRGSAIDKGLNGWPHTSLGLILVSHSLDLKRESESSKGERVRGRRR